MKNYVAKLMFAASATLLLGSVSQVQAQSFSSFSAANIFGVGLTKVASSGNFNYTVSLHAGDYFTLGSNTTKYYIEQIQGVFQLFDSAHADTSITAPTNWKPKDNGDQMFGFTGNSDADRIDNPGSLSGFIFSSTAPSSWGFHFSYTTDPTLKSGITTAYYKGLPGENGFPPNSIPEPAFYQMSGLLLLGGLGAMRMRKNRK